jgi:H+-transporting ATPase
VAVYGIFVAPIGWTYALAVWGYALLWLPINDLIAQSTRRIMEHRSQSQIEHIVRNETRIR